MSEEERNGLRKQRRLLREKCKNKDKEIERLEKRNKEIYEGFMATTEELCEATKETEKLEKINKKLWEENTRLSNGRELDQNVIDTLRERIDKAIEYIENKKLHQKVSTVPTYSMQERELLDILRGDDKE